MNTTITQLPNKPMWTDISNSFLESIKYQIENGSVIITIIHYDNKWIMNLNVNAQTTTMISKNLEDAKKEAIAIARKYAETLLDEICAMENI